MKAVVWHGVGDIRLEKVDDPKIQDPKDAIVKITRSAICGTDLHEQAIPVSDIFPTGYFAADEAEVRPGDTVAVFGCGPVGLFAIASAGLMGARRIFAIDRVADRLSVAQHLGAEVINFDEEHPVEVLKELTGGVGPDRVIDVVGVDAVRPEHGPAAKESDKHKDEFKREVKEIAPKTNVKGDNWEPGNAPSQVLRWALESVAKAGTVCLTGVYPESMMTYPVGKSMNKNITVKGGNCNHLRYAAKLLEMVRAGVINPARILTKHQGLTDVLEAYRQFDVRNPGWIKVDLRPAA